MAPRSLLRLARRAGVGSAILIAMAMLAYPGGTLRDPSTRGYSFFHNFLSDLGTRAAWGGQPNTVGAALFLTGFVILAAALAGLATGYVRLCSRSPGGRGAADAAGVAALAASLALVGAAATPADRAFSLHVGLAMVAHVTAPVAGLLFALATARDRRFGTGVPVGWVGVALVPIAMMAVREWGPGIGTDGGLVFHVTVQKVATAMFATLCVYLCVGAEWVAGGAGSHAA